MLLYPPQSRAPVGYVGTRRMENALQEFPEARFEVTWHSYMIDPSTPEVCGAGPGSGWTGGGRVLSLSPWPVRQATGVHRCPGCSQLQSSPLAGTEALTCYKKGA